MHFSHLLIKIFSVMHNKVRLGFITLTSSVLITASNTKHKQHNTKHYKFKASAKYSYFPRFLHIHMALSNPFSLAGIVLRRKSC